jgi:hypothetical protein
MPEGPHWLLLLDGKRENFPQQRQKSFAAQKNAARKITAQRYCKENLENFLAFIGNAF